VAPVAAVPAFGNGHLSKSAKGAKSAKKSHRKSDAATPLHDPALVKEG
jgi:hypothetical protein